MVVMTHCQLLAIDNSTNATLEATVIGGGGNGKEIVTMASEMPQFVSAGPMPNRTKEITIINTLTFTGYFQVGSRATETIRIALKRLSSIPNWLPGYSLRFEMIDDASDDAIAIPELVKKFRFTANQSRFPIALLTETSGAAQIIPASMLKQFNFLSLTVYLNTQELINRQKDLTNYVGFGLRPDLLHSCLVALFYEMGWSRYSLITEVQPYWSLVSFSVFFVVFLSISLSLS